MRASKALAIAMVAAAVWGASVARAIERTKIPPLTLTARDGQTRSGESLQRPGHWLLVVVHPGCVPCRTMLEALAALPADAAAQRMVIVVADGTTADASDAIDRLPTLAAAEWLNGSSAELTAALKLNAAATLFGVSGTMIEWSVSGVLTDTADLRSIMSSWLLQQK